MFIGIGMPITRSGAAAAAVLPPELFPDPTVVTAGDATNGWTLVGNAFDAAPGIQFDGGGSVDSASLAGTNQTAFNASVANSSTKSVSITASNWSAGTVIVTIKGGTPVAFAFTGNGTITHNVTAGTGSGFLITGDDVDAAALYVANISVT